MGDIALDAFALRQFQADYAGTKISVSPETFMERVLAFYDERKKLETTFQDRPTLIDGYAPFCKHLFMPNFLDDVTDGAMQITTENEHLLRSKYDARTEQELPVLIRYFPKEQVHAPRSEYLDLILYSKEQIEKENVAMGKPIPTESSPWRLISIKGQAVPHELPMNPITIMRNALISEGGSGVPIDRTAYFNSVQYWKSHAAIL